MGANILTAEAKSSEIASVMDSVRRIVQALRVSARGVEQKMGISGAQLFVLQQLAREPARSINELADRTHTHQSSVSVVVTRLVEAGLVRRKPDPEDGRRMMIELSARGRQMLEQSPETAQARLVAGLQQIPAEHLHTLAEGLQLWLTEAGLAEEAPEFFFEEEQSEKNNG
jgi:DNA-binding MarR family transcriptional regulator